MERSEGPMGRGTARGICVHGGEAASALGHAAAILEEVAYTLAREGRRDHLSSLLLMAADLDRIAGFYPVDPSPVPRAAVPADTGRQHY